MKPKITKLDRVLEIIRRDRTISALLLILIFTNIWMMFDVFLNTKFNQTQTWYRYVSFSAETYSRANWYYGYAWALLSIVTTSLHIALAAKLARSNYREAAALVLSLGIILIIIANASFNLILTLPR